MSSEEKILLIKLILEDIRGNWGWENGNRDAEAYKLSRELYKSTNDEKWDKLSECIARYEHGEDGIIVDYCYDYSYIEIFGLTDKEFENLIDNTGHLKTFNIEERSNP